MKDDVISRQAAIEVIDAVLSVIPYDDYWEEKVAEYCDNDVLATEAVFEALQKRAD